VLADEVGNDVAYKVTLVFKKAYGDRMVMPKLLEAMYENKLFGKKSGAGFYFYKGDKRTFNPKVEELRNKIGTTAKTMTEEQMRNRVFLLMINEAARCLEEGVVESSPYLDMALVMGIGFPPFRGGLLKYADTLGIDFIVNNLNDLQKSTGQRFAPCNRLLEMQRSKQNFYR
jgi:3-hydroxyacyl-CoA dehydrogenase/enoyl-CoA hydratase/3-hydroxybutyryl-CoA epimerase